LVGAVVGALVGDVVGTATPAVLPVRVSGEVPAAHGSQSE
jgi:hypothetical protein